MSFCLVAGSRSFHEDIAIRFELPMFGSFRGKCARPNCAACSHCRFGWLSPRSDCTSRCARHARAGSRRSRLLEGSGSATDSDPSQLGGNAHRLHPAKTGLISTRLHPRRWAQSTRAHRVFFKLRPQTNFLLRPFLDIGSSLPWRRTRRAFTSSIHLMKLGTLARSLQNT
jgi:hypothetical protein